MKATMPSEIYGTLYNQNDLNTVLTMVKDIYAKKPEPASLPTVTAVVAPFTLMKALNGSSKQTHFHNSESLSERMDRLTETLYWMDMEGKTTKKPYEPYITSPRDRGGRNGSRSRECHPGSNHGEGWSRSKKEDSKEEEEDFPIEEDHKEESSTKVPPQGGPKYLAKLKTKTKTDVTITTSEDTL